MVFQQVYGLPRGTVYVQGAPGAVVTYTSAMESGTVTLDSDGNGTLLQFKSGVYAFSEDVSGASKTNVRVRPGDTVYMWPNGARILYWYGRMGLLDDGETVQTLTTRINSGDFWDGIVQEETNYLKLVAQARYDGQYRHTGRVVIHFQPVDMTGFTKLNYAIGDRSTTNWGGPSTWLGQKSTISGDNAPNEFATKDTTITYTVDRDAPYIAASANDNSAQNATYSSAIYELRAVWLEP